MNKGYTEIVYILDRSGSMSGLEADTIGGFNSMMEKQKKTGEKALVIRTNDDDFLRPTVLSFRDNSIIDLSNRRAYGDLEIVDIMKTMDNRYVMNTDKMKALGIKVEEPDYV